MSDDEIISSPWKHSAGNTAEEDDGIPFVSQRHSAGDTASEGETLSYEETKTNEETKNPYKNLLGTRITLLRKDQVLMKFGGRER
jgi:hypothetical protein